MGRIASILIYEKPILLICKFSQFIRHLHKCHWPIKYQRLIRAMYLTCRFAVLSILGPIWATFGLLIKISLCCSTNLYSADRLNCAKFPSLKCAHIFLWLNLTLHSKFHNTSNTSLLPIPVGLLVLPCTRQCRRSPITPSPLFSVPDRGTGEGVRYNSLLRMCTLNTLTWPDLTWPDLFSIKFVVHMKSYEYTPAQCGRRIQTTTLWSVYTAFYVLVADRHCTRTRLGESSWRRELFHLSRMFRSTIAWCHSLWYRK